MSPEETDRRRRLRVLDDSLTADQRKALGERRWRDMGPIDAPHPGSSYGATLNRGLVGYGEGGKPRRSHHDRPNPLPLRMVAPISRWDLPHVG